MEGLGAAATRRLMRAAFRLCTEPGPERPALAAIAAAAGIAEEAVLHWYDDRETLCRLAVAERIAALAAPLDDPRRPALPLGEAIRGYAGACAAIFASDDYRRLIYLVMRDGPSCPWLVAHHERGLIETVRSGLSDIVRRAGAPSGARLDIRASGTRLFVRRLQEELALPMLLPRRKPPSRSELRALVDRIADEALGAVYSAQAAQSLLCRIAAASSARNAPAAATRSTHGLL